MDTTFSARYTNANLAKDAASYDTASFLKLQTQLQQVLPSATFGLSTGILVAMLCAQQRGNAAGPLVNDTLATEGQAHVLELFAPIREALTMSVGFVGLPNIMPAVFGCIAELKKRHVSDIQAKERSSFETANYSTIGLDTRQNIYRGVGNSEVASMVTQYLPDLSYLATSAFFGYAIGGCDLMPLQERELVVVGAIIALGASRQARSHCKAALQLGNSSEILQTIDDVAQSLATWNGRPLPERLAVPQLLEELQQELSSLGK